MFYHVGYDKNPHKFFNTTINGLSHKYNQKSISACAKCNNNLLSTLEQRILQLFLAHQQHQNFFNDEEKADIIRWLELHDIVIYRLPLNKLNVTIFLYRLFVSFSRSFLFCSGRIYMDAVRQ